MPQHHPGSNLLTSPASLSVIRAMALLALSFGCLSQASGASRPSAAIHGKVTIEGGAPPAKATVEVLKMEIDPKSKRAVWKAKYKKEVDESGWYQIENIEPGTYNLIAHDENRYNYDYRYKNEKLGEGENREFPFKLTTGTQKASLRGNPQGFGFGPEATGYVVVNAADCDGCVIAKIPFKSNTDFETELVASQDYLLTFESTSIPEDKKFAAIPISIGPPSSYSLTFAMDNGILTAKLIQNAPVSQDIVNVVAQRDVVELPLTNLPSYTNLALLSPNVVTSLSIRNSSNANVSGSSSPENRYIIDNSPVAENQVTYALQSGSQSADNELQLSQGGYSSRRGVTLPGELTNIVTSAGSSQFHGLADYSFRNDAFDAHNFFSLPKFNRFHKQALSIQLSGPLKIAPRTFFSLAYDFKRAATSPTFSTILTSQISALNSQFSRLGLPTEDLRRLTTTSALDAPLFRIDHTINTHNSLLFRYRYTGDRIKNDFSVAPTGTSPAPSAARTVSDDNQFSTIQYTHDAQPNSLTVSYRYRRDVLSLAPVEPRSLSLLIPGLILSGRTPNIATGDYRWQANHLLSLAFNTRSHGMHTIASGIQIGLDRNRMRFASFDSGRAIISSMAALSVANPIVELFESGTGGTEVRYNNATANYYLQDTFQAKSNLTFTFGIRNKMEFASFQQKEFNGLQPSASLAWDIQNKGRQILRAGYALHRERRRELPIGFELLMGGGPNLPANMPSAIRRVYSFVGNNAASAAFNQFRMNQTVSPGPLLATNYAADSRSPMFQTFNVRLDHEFRSRTHLELSYVFEHGNRLLTATNLNLPPPVLVSGREDFRVMVLNPSFAQIYQFQTTGKSNYSGLSATGRIQALKNLFLLATYTLSKTTDDVPSGSFEATPENVFDRAKDRSLSDFHLGQDLLVSARLDLTKRKPKQTGRKPNLFARLMGQPFLQSYLEVRSGQYFNVTTGFDANHDGNPLTDRPLDVGRNTFLGPRFSELDLRFGSNSISERKRFQWSVDVFNVFNHTNFASINTVIDAGSLVGLDAKTVTGRRGIPGFDYRRPLTPSGFGLATSALTPRRIQITLRYSF